MQARQLVNWRTTLRSSVAAGMAASKTTDGLETLRTAPTRPAGTSLFPSGDCSGWERLTAKLFHTIVLALLLAAFSLSTKACNT